MNCNDYGICEKYSGLANSFLGNRYQRVVLNRQPSYLSQVKGVVPKTKFLVFCYF